MPFCGLVGLGAHADPVPAAALASWVDGNACDASEFDVGGGRFWTFSLVANSAYLATTQLVHDGAVVGHVPERFAAEPLLDALDRGGPTIGILPDTEFALAAWRPSRRRLVLFRDPIGARALYFVHEPDEWVAFASVPEPLLALPGVTDRIDEDALPALLVVGVEPEADATVFTRLRRVPAAHHVTFDPAGSRRTRFWSLSGAPLRRPDPGVPARLRELLDASVRRRLDGVTHAAAHLSGGLDSSVVAAIAGEVTAATGDTLSLLHVRAYNEQGGLVDPEEAELADELISRMPRARAQVIAHGKTALPYFLFQQRYLDRPLPELVCLLGPEDRVLRQARDAGCQTLLTGWGGDQMVSYRSGDHVVAMLTERRWSCAARSLAHEGQWLRNVKNLVLSPLRSQLTRASSLVPGEREVLMAPFRGRALEDRIGAELSADARRLPLRARRRSLLDGPAFHRAMELLDWLGQRYGVVVRHPLQDRELLELCDRMPIEWVADAGERRRAIRHAVRDLLPQAMVEREKAPRTMPSRNQRWRQRHQDAVKGALFALARTDTWLHQYLDIEALARQYEIVDGSDTAPATFRARQLAVHCLVAARVVNLKGAAC